MTEPTEYPQSTPCVTLGGREWPVPELAIRQLRAVRRPLIDLTEAIAATDSESAGERVLRLTTAQYESMCEVVYQGLTRAHPTLSRDEFLDLAATDAEIFLAFLVVRRQSGVYVARDAEASTTGEASPTGTR
jgi:hypothetical protein